MNRRRALVRLLSAVIVSSLLIALILSGCASKSPEMEGAAASAGGAGGGYVEFDAGPRTSASPPSQRREELWVIPRDANSLDVADARPRPSVSQLHTMRRAPSTGPAGMRLESRLEEAVQIPGSGTLMTRLPDSQNPVPVPLKHTDVKASIAGYVATVDVTQQYHNPYSGKIEAVYVFPLPANAAVNEFLMTIGERKIRGIIRERAEAEQIYKAARAQGHVASLMTQERPNVFTQSVANIEPGKQIDVNVKYFHTLEYVDGWYEYVFPMVVGPRFNPPGYSEGIGAAGRGDRGASGQAKEVQYLRPTERSGGARPPARAATRRRHRPAR